MKYLLVCFIGLTSLLNAQSDSLQFPQDFYGVYKGKLTIVNANGTQELDMEFHLQQTDSLGKYQYTLVYIINGNRQERLYNLIEKDAEKGNYIVDENNGIFLNAKLVNNTLYSMFEVQGNILTTTERFYKDHMDFEIIFSRKSAQKESGTLSDEPIKVISYPITVLQKAKLKRVPVD